MVLYGVMTGGLFVVQVLSVATVVVSVIVYLPKISSLTM